jgi:hypothetical protein
MNGTEKLKSVDLDDTAPTLLRRQITTILHNPDLFADCKIAPIKQQEEYDAATQQNTDSANSNYTVPTSVATSCFFFCVTCRIFFKQN